ncbi:hypothetical protein UNDKW_4127 [Undibacterium sp. KW1]|uniref:hypothetical protein n=1 Tax=Undibacterium sp. KW1 TaxID=2058624 RepID=UPI001331D2CB|nr:hypothetical protein [Undibacterium sp. KW1]BBB62400.1 hypothetical protein UNDKW_4127 [Undibacterium sp. KW1]
MEILCPRQLCGTTEQWLAQVDLATDFSWQSKVQYDLFQSATTIQGSVGLWNASVALAAPENGWRLALIAKNLGDKSYAINLVNGTNTVTRAVPRDDQRYFGVNFRKDF